MAKPIVISEELILQMAEDFKAKLRSAKLSDGSVNYTQKLTYDTKDYDKVCVLFEPVAYAKMVLLINGFDTEIAWHGTVRRAADDCFIIKDIFVYPQEVDGANANTDQEKYQQWMMHLDDETYNDLHMQAHSHVNMSTFASQTDVTHQEEIIAQLGDQDFYIFMIWNKRLERNIRIFDRITNTLYENSDIVTGITGDTDTLDTFMKDAKAMATRKTYAAKTNPAYSGSSAYGGNAKSDGKVKGFQNDPPASQVPAIPASTQKSTQSKGQISYMDSVKDWDDEIYNRQYGNYRYD